MTYGISSTRLKCIKSVSRWLLVPWIWIQKSVNDAVLVFERIWKPIFNRIHLSWNVFHPLSKISFSMPWNMWETCVFLQNRHSRSNEHMQHLLNKIQRLYIYACVILPSACIIYTIIFKWNMHNWSLHNLATSDYWVFPTVFPVCRSTRWHQSRIIYSRKHFHLATPLELIFSLFFTSFLLLEPKAVIHTESSS